MAQIIRTLEGKVESLGFWLIFLNFSRFFPIIFDFSWFFLIFSWFFLDFSWFFYWFWMAILSPVGRFSTMLWLVASRHRQVGLTDEVIRTELVELSELSGWEWNTGESNEILRKLCERKWRIWGKHQQIWKIWEIWANIRNTWGFHREVRRNQKICRKRAGQKYGGTNDETCWISNCCNRDLIRKI